MPANKKYLISSAWVKTSKVIACIFGALFCTLAIHLLAALCIDIEMVMLTSLYSVFMVWVMLMFMVYYIRKAWLSWLILVSVTAVCAVLIVIIKKGGL